MKLLLFSQLFFFFCVYASNTFCYYYYYSPGPGECNTSVLYIHQRGGGPGNIKEKDLIVFFFRQRLKLETWVIRKGYTLLRRFSHGQVRLRNAIPELHKMLGADAETTPPCCNNRSTRRTKNSLEGNFY